MNKRIKLGTDIKGFELAQKMEASIESKIDKLNTIAMTSYGKPVKDLSKVLADPITYYSEAYFIEYGHLFPATKDKVTIFTSNVKYYKEELEHLTNSIKNTVTDLGANAPTFIKDKMVSNLDIKNFDSYVSNDKVELYKSVMGIIKADKKLRDVRKDNRPMFHQLRVLQPYVKLEADAMVVNENYFL